jgi:DNA polymerase-3 subunit chi
MTERVDFYVLSSSAVRSRWIAACRLAEKAYLDNRKVVILQANAQDAKALDELLWTFDERSFVPHALLGEATDATTPVRLAGDAGELPPADLLINLSDALPPALERFAQVAEIIDAEPERRRLGRDRFRSYRDLKLALETHQIADPSEI